MLLEKIETVSCQKMMIVRDHSLSGVKISRFISASCIKKISLNIMLYIIIFFRDHKIKKLFSRTLMVGKKIEN